MKTILTFLLSFCFLSVCTAQNKNESGLKIRFASQDEAKTLLTSTDSYTERWSKFDIAARLQDPDGTKEGLMELLGNSALEWSDAEKTRMDSIISTVMESCAKQQFVLPPVDEIVLIKSTMREEGGAGAYTRQNWIVFAENVFTAPDRLLQKLFAHELFHVLTRNSPEFKKKMYATIGFTIMDEGIVLPESFRDRQISNPDIHSYDSYATFTINGEPKKCAMVLYTNRGYRGGNFFSYLNVGFVPLDDHLKPVEEEGYLVVYGQAEVSDFLDKVGRNTSYVIHPEEVLAENFAFAVLDNKDLTDPELVEKIQQILKEGKY